MVVHHSFATRATQGSFHVTQPFFHSYLASYISAKSNRSRTVRNEKVRRENKRGMHARKGQLGQGAYMGEGREPRASGTTVISRSPGRNLWASELPTALIEHLGFCYFSCHLDFLAVAIAFFLVHIYARKQVDGSEICWVIPVVEFYNEAEQWRHLSTWITDS